MKPSIFKRALNRLRRCLHRNPQAYLKTVRGIIHVGANIGQERRLYAKYRLRVLWIEPLADIYRVLSDNIAGLDRQRAVNYLVTDKDDVEHQFHVANNDGLSSSIYAFAKHKDIWPTVAYTHTISLRSITLTSLLQRENIDPAEYEALALDTQGSELLILQGARALLHRFKYIATEVADFEAYTGCCDLEGISSFLTQNGFEEMTRHVFATRPAGGNYYDVVYRRVR